MTDSLLFTRPAASARAVIRQIDVHPVERWFKVTTFDNREVIYRDAGDEIEIVSSESLTVLEVPEKAAAIRTGKKQAVARDGERKHAEAL